MTEHDLVFHRNTRNLPSKKNIQPNRCEWPWKGVHIDRLGRIFLCGCDAWVPYSVGHILDFNTIDDIFSSPTAKMVQGSINQGEYEYCDTFHCGVIAEMKTIPYDYEIQIGIDDSCNLQCPSCRSSMIFRDDDGYVNERKIWLNRVKSWINQVPDKKINILTGSNGEPFASPIYKEFLKSEFTKNVHYEIRSNATLIRKHIDELAVLPNLKIIRLSIDAATAATYERVRRPAKWNTLLDNIDYLNILKETYNFKTSASFVIQRENLEDVLPFIDFCEDNEINYCDFTLLQDWGSFSNFKNEAVHDPEHELYNRFREIISDKKLRKLNPPWLVNY
jgi:wyosine [tRNA(Phe)-imidazoG37] synthetase (radical SAM superfamily)